MNDNVHATINHGAVPRTANPDPIRETADTRQRLGMSLGPQCTDHTVRERASDDRCLIADEFVVQLYVESRDSTDELFVLAYTAVRVRVY